MSTENYREEQARHHAENQAALGKIERRIDAGTAETNRRLDQNTAVLNSVVKIPVAVVMILAVSALFYVGKVSERTWLVVLFVSLFPWFGDSIRVVFDILLRRSAVDTKETIVNTSKLVALGGAAAMLLSGCGTPVKIGATYHGQYGDYTVTRQVSGEGPAQWDVLIGLDGKRIVPFEK